MLDQIQKATDLSYQAELIFRRTEREAPLVQVKAERIRAGIKILSEQQEILKTLARLMRDYGGAVA